ncbi:MAG: hypothetical protein ACI4I1_05915 [Oscillospiraceae bacterium]
MSWDEKLDSSFLRDQNFNINGERMRVTVRGFKISLMYELISSAAMMYISALCVLYKMSYVISNSIASNILAKVNDIIDTGKKVNDVVYDTSGWLITLPLALLIIIFSILGNSFNIKFAPKVIAVIYPIHIILGILAGFGLFDDMNNIAAVFLLLYGIAGFWVNDLTMRGIKELDYLVTQEGFPTFNLAVFYFRRSHYAKMREKWLAENPVKSEPTRIITEEKRMEMLEVTAEEEKPGIIPNIQVTAESAEKWLDQNKIETDKKQYDSVMENGMDNLSTEDLTLPDTDEYYEQSITPKVKRH